MKQCPFCREEVHDDATKCRYCASPLAASPGKKPETALADGETGTLVYVRPGKVAWVIDDDLVRFAKFAISAIVIFFTIGAAVYSFDVQHASEKVGDMAEKVREMADKLRDAQAAVDTQANTVSTDARQIEVYRQQIGEMYDEIKKKMPDINKAFEQAQIVNRGQPGLAAPTTTSIGPSPPPAVEAPGYTGRQLAMIYGFPSTLTGTGQTIGLIELAGGYKLEQLAAYFSSIGATMPAVTSVSVDGAQNSPENNPNGADGEVYGNIEIAGGTAPDARIVVYFGPNTASGFLHAVTTSIHDNTNKPSVIVIGWGSPEAAWNKTIMSAMNQAFQEAQALGITICVAAGDRGATDGMSDGRRHVDFPASSPYVLAVGGTKMLAKGDAILSEAVWNDGVGGATGGGVSDVFPLPEWQSRAGVPVGKDGVAGRGIADVVASASPTSGFRVSVDGHSVLLGGTSMTAPFWAGLVALLNQGVGHNLGYINPILYEQIGPGGAFRSITKGDNGYDGVAGYPAAGPGWSPAAGWGSPDGEKLLAALRVLPTPSRP